MVAKTYFRHVPIHVLLLLPVTWGLLPVAGLAPHLLQPYVPAVAMKTVLSLQWIFALVFKSICAIHVLELAIALVLCLRLGLTWGTTGKWLANVAFNGFFALRMLIKPSQAKTKKSA